MRPMSRGRSNQLIGRYQGTTAYGARAAAGEAEIKEEDGQAYVGRPEPADEAQNQLWLMPRDEPQSVATVINGEHPRNLILLQ